MMFSFINSQISPSSYGQNNIYQEHILEQYKLYVEMADRASARRQKANNYFIALNTLVLSVFGTIIGLKKDSLSSTWLVLVGILGIVLSVTWWLILLSYRQLNAGKFEVVDKLESILPVKPYAIEWILLGQGTDNKKYFPISRVEQIIPILICVVYFWIIFTGFTCVK